MNGFLGSTILEAAIGASFVYLLLAAFCSTVNEWIATLLGARAGTLRVAIRELLNHQSLPSSLAEADGFLNAFYGHPLITGLAGNVAHPSWLPSRSFSIAVMDLATSHKQGSITFSDLENGIRDLPDGDVKTSLLALVQNVQNDLTRAQSNIESWFNDAMSHASGWYKRRTRIWTVAIAAAATIGVNADTINMLRAHGPNQIVSLGWATPAMNSNCWEWFSRIAGWLLTIAAVSLGAPFWFDLLNKAINPRSERSTARSESAPQ